MNINTLITKIRDVWAEDQEIRQFCVDEYNVLPSVFVGIDEENPPEPEHLPMLCIYEFLQEGGMSLSRKKITMSVGVALEDPRIETDDLQRVKTHIGLLKVEELRLLMEKALLNARIGRVNWQSESGVIYKFPVFTSLSIITIENINDRQRR